MTVFVFSGPTLSAAEVRAELDAVCVPPAAQGDIYRAAREKPKAIGLIDGRFDSTASVWHKEILWAMSRGIHVFGSASMGALRAAELAPLGMEGVGVIFEAFQSGDLEDDDEVAVAHASAEHDHRPLSEAMVNIRATLRAAEGKGILEPQTRSELERIAKAMFYPDRSYRALLAAASRAGVDPKALGALEAFLPSGAVQQKRLDALAMLRRMRDALASKPAPKRVAYTFEHTAMWEQLVSRAGRERLAVEAPSGTSSLDALIAQLHADGTFTEAHTGALARALAIEEAERAGVTVNSTMLRATAEAFRLERALFTPDELDQWMEQQRIANDDELLRLLRDEAKLRWIHTMFGPDVRSRLADHLRVTGAYGPILARIEGQPPNLETSDNSDSSAKS